MNNLSGIQTVRHRLLFNSLDELTTIVCRFCEIPYLSNMTVLFKDPKFMNLDDSDERKYIAFREGYDFTRKELMKWLFTTSEFQISATSPHASVDDNMILLGIHLTPRDIELCHNTELEQFIQIGEWIVYYISNDKVSFDVAHQMFDYLEGIGDMPTCN